MPTISSQIPDSKTSQASPPVCCVQKLLLASAMSSHSRHRITLHSLISACLKLYTSSKLGLSSIRITCHHSLLLLRLQPQPLCHRQSTRVEASHSQWFNIDICRYSRTRVLQWGAQTPIRTARPG